MLVAFGSPPDDRTDWTNPIFRYRLFRGGPWDSLAAVAGQPHSVIGQLPALIQPRGLQAQFAPAAALGPCST